MVVDEIPVILDFIQKDEDFRMARCTYLLIDFDIPSLGWRLSAGSFDLPFMMMGLEGIIYRSINDGGYFNNPEDYEAIHKVFEDRIKSLYIETNDLWIPSKEFFKIGKHEIGGIYRIARELFLLAYSFRINTIGKEEYISEIYKLDKPISFSKKETKAFAVWKEKQKEQARENFNSESALPRKEDEDKDDTEGESGAIQE